MTSPSKPSKSRARVRRRFDLRRDGVKIFVVLAVLLIVNLGFWMIMVRPRQAQIDQLDQDKKNADLNERRAERSLEALRAVNAHVDDVRAGIGAFFDEMLSTKANRSVTFQRALNDVGRDFNVIPQKVSLGLTPMAQEEIEVLGFSFPLTGGYENLRNFLARLEALDQFLIVREVTLRGSSEGGRTLQLDVNVETFFNSPELRERIDREKSTRGTTRRGGPATRRP